MLVNGGRTGGAETNSIPVVDKINNNNSPSSTEKHHRIRRNREAFLRLTKSEYSATDKPRRPSFSWRRMSYAFGSSTPREFSYMNHVPLRYRVYDVKLRSRRRKGEPTLTDYLRDVRSGSRNRDHSLDSSIQRVFVFGSSTPRDWSHLEGIPRELRGYDTKIGGNHRRSKTTASFSSGGAAADKRYVRRTSSMENVSNAKKPPRPRKSQSATRTRTPKLKSPTRKSKRETPPESLTRSVPPGHSLAGEIVSKHEIPVSTPEHEVHLLEPDQNSPGEHSEIVLTSSVTETTATHTVLSPEAEVPESEIIEQQREEENESIVPSEEPESQTEEKSDGEEPVEVAPPETEDISEPPSQSPVRDLVEITPSPPPPQPKIGSPDYPDQTYHEEIFTKSTVSTEGFAPPLEEFSPQTDPQPTLENLVEATPSFPSPEPEVGSPKYPDQTYHEELFTKATIATEGVAPPSEKFEHQTESPSESEAIECHEEKREVRQWDDNGSSENTQHECQPHDEQMLSPITSPREMDTTELETEPATHEEAEPATHEEAELATHEEAEPATHEEADHESGEAEEADDEHVISGVPESEEHYSVQESTRVTSRDVDGDGIPDLVEETVRMESHDIDGDGVPDITTTIRTTTVTMGSAEDEGVHDRQDNHISSDNEIRVATMNVEAESEQPIGEFATDYPPESPIMSPGHTELPNSLNHSYGSEVHKDQDEQADSENDDQSSHHTGSQKKSVSSVGSSSPASSRKTGSPPPNSNQFGLAHGIGGQKPEESGSDHETF